MYIYIERERNVNFSSTVTIEDGFFLWRFIWWMSISYINIFFVYLFVRLKNNCWKVSWFLFFLCNFFSTFCLTYIFLLILKSFTNYGCRQPCLNNTRKISHFTWCLLWVLLVILNYSAQLINNLLALFWTG